MAEQMSDTVRGAQVPAGGVRVSDADRGRVAAVLGEAHAEGRLSLGEFDERVRGAYGAVVAGDLVPLTADLPAATPVPERRPRPAPSPCVPGAGGSLRAAAAVWAVVSTLNVVIWLALTLRADAVVYPWWVWVAGPWGVVLILRAASERLGPDRPGTAV